MQWLLPDGVEEWLPPDSWSLEALRRRVIDIFAAHGFELILAPLLEYTESLHSGVGQDLASRTFVVTDQSNGRAMGLRADITPQAARIDAHRYAADAAGVRRLCYLGSVLRTHPDVPGGPRSLRQLGAEIFGFPGLEADVEVISLMCAVLQGAGHSRFTLDLGHVGILRSLLPANLASEDAERLLPAIQRKSACEIEQLGRQLGLRTATIAALADLCDWHGPPAALQARLGDAAAEIRQPLEVLLDLSRRLQRRFPDLDQHLDCGELSGFRYETGVTWAVYERGLGRALARGGRYDGIGKSFGNTRAATGFSADLNALLRRGDAADAEQGEAVVWAPAGDDPAMLAAIAQLRQSGRRVRQLLPGEGESNGARLACVDGEWNITDTEVKA